MTTDTHTDRGQLAQIWPSLLGTAVMLFAVIPGMLAFAAGERIAGADAGHWLVAFGGLAGVLAVLAPLAWWAERTERVELSRFTDNVAPAVGLMMVFSLVGAWTIALAQLTQ
jgi:hypothetical protein